MSIIKRPRPNEDMVMIPIALIQDQNISAAAKLVYMADAAHDRQGEPEPSIDTICDETGLTRRAVEAGISELEGLSPEAWRRLGL